MKEKILFVMPLRNRRQNAIQSVTSLATSVYAEHFEVLIVQDFDTDNVSESDFASIGIPVSVVNQSVGGIFYKTALMNFGVAVTMHQVIVQQDADILYSEDFLKMVVRLSENKIFFEKNIFYAPYHESEDMRAPAVNVDSDHIRKKGDFVGDTFIFFRPQFVTVRGYDERMRIWHEEEDIANRIGKHFNLQFYNLGAVGIANTHKTHDNDKRSFSFEEVHKNRRLFQENAAKKVTVLTGQSLGRLSEATYAGKNILLRNNEGDMTAVRENFVEDVYGTKSIALSPESVVLDIGAHIGCFALFCSDKVKEVICYEPDTANFLLLKKNVERNGITNVTAYKSAVAAKNAEIDFFVNPILTVLNSPVRKSMSAFSQKVRAVSLEEIIGEKKIDLLKIDCEGGEYRIFYDAPSKVFEKIACIAMEYHNLPEIDESFVGEKLIAHLVKNGFTVENHLPDYDPVGKTGIVLLKQEE